MLRSKKYKSLIGIAPLVAIASASVVAATSCNAPVVLKEIHANGESDRVTTTELVLTANKSIAHITTNDVRFSMNLIYATSINSVTKDDEVIYTIQVRGNWANNTTVKVSLTKYGYSVKNELSVTLWKDDTIHITLVNLYQVGGESGTKTTTALNFVVSQEFNLSINDITLSNPNVSKDSLSYDAQGTTYSLAISGSENWDNEESISMVIDEIPGFTIDNQTTPVTLFKDLTTHVTLSNLQQVGGESGNQTTTALSFILDVEVGLTTANVNFTNSNITSIDALSHEVGTLYYEITISGVWDDSETTGISIAVENYTINSDGQTANLYRDTTTHVTLTDLTQVGGVSGTETTTALKLGSEADFGLTKDNVTFDNSAVRAASVSYDKGAKAYTITIEPTDQTTGWANGIEISLIIPSHINNWTINNQTPKVAIYTDTTIKITLSDLEQVGGVSGTKTTTGLTFEASAQFDLNVNDITFTNTKISANEISYSSVDSSYTITITGNWANNESTNVSIVKNGYKFTNNLESAIIYKDSTTHVTLSNLQQLGGVSGTQTTTALEFTTSQEIVGLVANNITFSNNKVVRGTLNHSAGTNTYTINISGSWSNGDSTKMIIDTLAVSNYTITNNTSDVTLYQDQTTHVEVKRLMANGEDGTETTTEIKWVFDPDISNEAINIDDITLTTTGSTQVTKNGFYYDDDIQEYVLEISGTWNNLDTITMGIFADGFTFTGQNQITLYKDTTTHMKIMALSADGTNAETTFDPMPLYWTSKLWITVNDISLWNMAWKPDDIMKFTIDGTRVFVNTGITITKLDKSIQINLTDAAKAQFSGTKTLTLEMLPIPGYTITGGPLVTQVYNP